ncbi:hypothetical protein [Capnocytophaga catalasegens]|uniref:Uncharacterized protein n=1 Tax=Capnocytophaga catalasegens TaxID=1004260 RepID=A0AAV5AYV8_9FLAO|nr:hypothetical protein [Capnocytophaga catalasegens]GIZ14435.1 hypothetical protein RCZ03_04360 [Capnocytophaga catalasegens]GJM50631.1 hypothetical protein RCZ15_16040 [Capnocytophaga catalasegens]GJM53368.1 hypothetical protein RCZ16_16850 [Capnocytophaga catalasegens]
MNIYSVKSDYSQFSQKMGILGDFADILWNGFVIHSRKNDTTAVERFGSDVPPIYVNNRQIILTDETKQQLETFDLQGFEFKEVEKRKIIKGDWLNFNESFFEKFNNPTFDPIEKGKHSKETAEAMYNLWIIKPLQKIYFKKLGNQQFEFSIEKTADFYIGNGDKLGIFISEKAKQIFEELALPLSYEKE